MNSKLNLKFIIPMILLLSGAGFYFYKTHNKQTATMFTAHNATIDTPDNILQLKDDVLKIIKNRSITDSTDTNSSNQKTASTSALTNSKLQNKKIIRNILFPENFNNDSLIEDLSSSDLANYINKADKIAAVLMHCLKEKTCGNTQNQPLFTQDSSAEQDALARDLDFLKLALQKDINLKSQVSAENIREALSMSHPDIQLGALQLLSTMDQITDSDYSTALKSISSIEGKSRGVLLSYLAQNASQTSTQRRQDLITNIKDGIEHSTEWTALQLVKQLPTMELNDREYVDVLRSACSWQHRKTEISIFWRRLQDRIEEDLEGSGQNISLEKICS